MDHDAHLLGLILDAGRAIVIAANKWDGLSGPKRTQVKRVLDRKLHFIDYATVRSISALHGSGLAELNDIDLTAALRWAGGCCETQRRRRCSVLDRNRRAGARDEKRASQRQARSYAPGRHVILEILRAICLILLGLTEDH